LPAIHLDNLTKIYKVAVREAGLRASLRSLAHRQHREVLAVDRISFDIEPGIAGRRPDLPDGRRWLKTPWL
jgi:ABC-2 type transport system ATP-binding protein